jgi:uncharacterized protein (DUF1697 family)
VAASGTASVVLLRGVNVGGNNRIAMADFKRVLTTIGATRADTYVNSGNAVVDLPAKGLAEQVGAALTAELGLTVGVVVVSSVELQAIVKANPWPELAETPKQLHVVFADEQADPALIARLGTVQGGDEFLVGKKCLYLRYGAQSHNSPIVPVLKKINGVTTARNWSTVLALLDLATS